MIVTAAAPALALTRTLSALPLQLKGRLLAQLTLRNMNDYLLASAPDTTGLMKLTLTREGGNVDSFYIDAERGCFYYRPEQNAGNVTYWAGPMPLALDAKQTAHVKATIGTRLMQVNLSDSLIKGPPPHAGEMVRFKLDTPGSPAHQTALVDFDRNELYMHVRHPDANGKLVEYWSGPIWLSIASLPR